ncbi:MAG: biotin--[acetyl-CoA-carboxylase] ligase [Thermoplasmata archaeon]|nr:biotin--[acetyl-CoA-carboxylase] ligase [Thermoplasmata archaeon]
MRWARDGAPEGTLIVAETQRSGRGRLDHRWTSPPGGLYLSIVLSEPARSLSLAPMAFGLAISETVGGYGAPTCLKWPNDVFTVETCARKLAGVLVDRIASPSLGHALVAGVGVNVAAPIESFAPALRSDIAQLNELVDVRRTPAQVEADLVPRIRAAHEALRTRGGQLNTVARCRARLYGRGRSARLDGRPVGTIRELDEDGSLWVEHAGHRENLHAGDLVVETP